MEWCVRSRDEIRMVHRSMDDCSRVADGLYIKRVLLVLEDFLFFSLYSFSCIASNSTTLENILTLVPRYSFRVQFHNIHITCARPRPLHLQAKAHIAKLNELTESEVTALTSSTVDETALAILKRQGSRGITIVSSQRKIGFDIQVDPY